MHYTVVIVYKFILIPATVTCITQQQETRFLEAVKIATDVFVNFKILYENCFQTAMPNLRFVTDDLNIYINEFSRTTVGLTPRFTSNRKFFLNLISHPKFKTVLAEDTAAVQNSMIDKMKFCDESTLDMEVLKQLYDREVDQTRL